MLNTKAAVFITILEHDTVQERSRPPPVLRDTGFIAFIMSAIKNRSKKT